MHAFVYRQNQGVIKAKITTTLTYRVFEIPHRLSFLLMVQWQYLTTLDRESESQARTLPENYALLKIEMARLEATFQ